ncbi:hypothetical protein FN846DRAFT_935595 [Sphaerosporella brunnea]|uniref:Uncharacterized protein n=1 Tax=Sphaerosporella brunnea TaxID=1250544 RepID=A0A5J5F621_9PEZI|nr:hypothetical protein FN846DRAFT_935595 [Sphaerosporella brunnea]
MSNSFLSSLPSFPPLLHHRDLYPTRTPPFLLIPRRDETKRARVFSSEFDTRDELELPVSCCYRFLLLPRPLATAVLGSPPARSSRIESNETMASDHDLDIEFHAENSTERKPMRPTSTLARAFANQLNDIFLLDDQLDQLDQNINRKKQSVQIQSSELALLEARLKQAEKLLEESKRRLAGRSQNPAGPTPNGSSVPDYTPNPAFSSTTAAAPAATENEESAAGERKSVHAHKMSGVYEMRPPPPPPSVPGI